MSTKRIIHPLVIGEQDAYGNYKRIYYKSQPKQTIFHTKIEERATNGFRHFLYGGSGGSGKLQNINSLVLTPFGFKKNIDLKVGDAVTNPDGSVCKVIQTHPVQYVDEYIIHFHDGTSTSCGIEHLWLAWRSDKKRKIKNKQISSYDSVQVVTTETLIKWLEYSKTHKRNYPLIPICQELPFNRQSRWKKAFIPPYMLGILLGDGCLTDPFSLTSMDPEVKTYLDKQGYDYYTSTKKNNKAVHYCFRRKTAEYLRKELSRFKLLHTRSHTKFIPEYYKLSSIEDRYELIRGLMDTDGTAEKSGHLSYATTSKQLADDVAWVLRSLGAVVTITTKNPWYYDKNRDKVECKLCYTLYIKHRTPEKLFSLPRKRQRVINTIPDIMYRKVVKIEKRDKQPMRCITVSHPNGLYLTNDFIVTHNSYSLRFQGHYECLQTPRLRVLLLRATYAELETTHLTDIVSDLPPELGRLNKSTKRFNYYNGSFIQFGYGERVEDFKRYLSTEYDIVLVDELTTMPFKLLLLIVNMRLRTTKEGFIPYFAAATNPGSMSHSEVKSYFVDKDFAGRFPSLAGDYQPQQVSYTRALVYDNKILLDKDPEVLGRMKQLPPDERKRLLEGSWDIFEGQYFTQFRTDIHVIPPCELPSDCLTFAGLDYGANTAMEIIKYNRNNNSYYVVGEWIAEHKEKDEIARYCYNYLDERGLKNIIIVGDHNMFPGPTNVKPQNTAWWEFRKLGLRLIHANKKKAPTLLYRIHCNRQVKQLLSWEQNLNNAFVKKPRLYIFDTCNNLARNLPALRIDPNNNEDIDPDGYDHSYDAMKMAIINHQRGDLSYEEEVKLMKQFMKAQQT